MFSLWKKIAVRPFTIKVTHSREQSKSNDEKRENNDVVVAATTNGMQQYSNEHLTFGKIDIGNGIPFLKANVCCRNTDFPKLITSKLEKGSELDFLDKDGKCESNNSE